MPSPSYNHIGDHTETIQIAFNSKEVSCVDILNNFFRNHQPNKTRLLKQYASIIFPHDQQQYEEATNALKSFEVIQKMKCTTDIVPFENTIFTNAEGYHQKYILQQYNSIMNVLEDDFQIIKGCDSFLNSELAAKLNGFYMASDFSDVGPTLDDIKDIAMRESNDNILATEKLMKTIVDLS